MSFCRQRCQWNENGNIVSFDGQNFVTPKRDSKMTSFVWTAKARLEQREYTNLFYSLCLERRQWLMTEQTRATIIGVVLWELLGTPPEGRTNRENPRVDVKLRHCCDNANMVLTLLVLAYFFSVCVCCNAIILLLALITVSRTRSTHPWNWRSLPCDLRNSSSLQNQTKDSQRLFTSRFGRIH